MLVRRGVPCLPFMFGQLCVALCVADGVGVAAVPVDLALSAVVPAVDDDDVDDAGVDEWVVAALATARLPPNPTPSAPAPTTVLMMILPSLVLNVPPPRGGVMVLNPGHPRWLRRYCSGALSAV